MSQIINVSTVPHRSPFRYPGGKTWLVPYVRRWLASLPYRPSELIEPFAGGAIVSLTALFEKYVDRVTLVEMDEDVGSVWNVVLNGAGPRLADDLATFKVSTDTVKHLLSQPSSSVYHRALATIVKNRVQRGGILAPGASMMKSGEDGRGISSRWYPATLRRRILDIVRLKDAINFIQGDGLAVLSDNAARRDVVYYIDPPYTVAGRRLYAHSEVDHNRLFKLASELSGDFLMTYDACDAVRNLADRYCLQIHEVPMKSTHHRIKHELLIGRNLDWATEHLLL
ncbi:MAG: DNA adenine methylase [Bacteroidetes bacterium]|nr:DNA adenine methylase [Bacteroidota bacterium]